MMSYKRQQANSATNRTNLHKSTGENSFHVASLKENTLHQTTCQDSLKVTHLSGPKAGAPPLKRTSATIQAMPNP